MKSHGNKRAEYVHSANHYDIHTVKKCDLGMGQYHVLRYKYAAWTTPIVVNYHSKQSVRLKDGNKKVNNHQR